MKIAPFLAVGLGLIFFLFSSFNTKPDPPIVSDKFVVVLDAGHGGHDPGNLGNGYLEKNIALGIVLAAGEVLESEQNIEVVYTRKEDRFVDLYVRGEIANKAKADLFVSVHCDSHNSDANGAGTFVLGLHANKQNFEIAKKENSVIYLEDNYESRYAAYDINSPESIIGLTIMQEEFLEQSILLGKMMQDNFTKNLKRKDRKVKQAGFIVLHQTFMPSILVETGFLTHKDEGAYLNSKNGQAEMGKAIADAIILYRDNLWSGSGAIVEEGEAVITSVPQVQKEEVQEPVAAVIEPEVTTETQVSKNDNETKVSKESETVVNPEKPVIEEAVAAGATVGVVEKEPKSIQVSEEMDPEQPVTEKAIEKVAAGDQKNEEASKEEITKETEKKTEPAEIAVAESEPPKEEKAEPSKETKEIKKPAETSVAEKPDNKSVQIIFKVQILASSKEIPLKSENFNGLNTISKEPYKNLTRYMYGRTNSYKQAKLLKSNADLKGYTTSFIVAYKEGVRIPVNEAVKYVSE